MASDTESDFDSDFGDVDGDLFDDDELNGGRIMRLERLNFAEIDDEIFRRSANKMINI